jgi:hypothetical protein
VQRYQCLTVAISGSRLSGYPHRGILSRVHCIAWMLIMASCMEATESYKPVTSLRLGVVCAEA